MKQPAQNISMRDIAILLITLVSCMIINLAHSMAQVSPEGRSELPDLEKADYTALARPDFARIEKVINANTIITQEGDVIRLVGLDIPHPPGEKGDIAHKAKAHLDQHLTGKRVRLYAVQDKDRGHTNRMGHKLRHVELRDKNIWVQGTLLHQGLARVRPTPANPEMAGQMYALERQARKDNRGLWAKARYHILGPDTAEKGIGAYQIVQGTIESAAMRGNRIYLNFGQNWRRDLTVSIPPGKRRAFRRSDIRLLKLGGETIRARGWLESYNGPYMEIAHPARLEILDKQTKSEDKP